MNLRELSRDLSDIDITFTSEHAVVIALGALGCAVVLFALSAWKNWGQPRLGNYMDSRKREREQLELMANHAIGSWEFIIKEGAMTPQDMWKLASKYDSIPGFRNRLRDMLKKHLPVTKEVLKQSKLSEALS